MKLHTHISIGKAPTNQFRLEVRQDNPKFGDVGIDWTTGREDPEASLSVTLGDGIEYSPVTGVSVDLDGDFESFSCHQDGSITYVLPGAGQINPTGPFNGTTVSQGKEGFTVDPDGPNNLVKVGEKTGMLSLDPEGPGNLVRLTQTDQGILFDPVGPNNNTLVSLEGDTITLTTEQDRRTTISRRGNKFTIDPHGFGNSTTVQRGESEVEVDLPGFGKALTIASSEKGFTVDSPGFGNTTSLTKEGNVFTVDPPGLGNSTTVTKEAKSALINVPGLGNSADVIFQS